MLVLRMVLLQSGRWCNGVLHFSASSQVVDFILQGFLQLSAH